MLDHCERNEQSYEIGEWMYDPQGCVSCLCERSGWDCHDAFCDEAAQCDDGGVCDGCELGTYRFPVGQRMVCEDGCNHCTCSALGKWVSTIQICDSLPPIRPCAQPPDSDTTYPLFLLDGREPSLSLKAEFSRGGCKYAPMKACYATSSAGGARIWLEPDEPLADCEVPFIAEEVVSVSSLRESYRREGREHGTIQLDFARESLPYAF